MNKRDLLAKRNKHICEDSEKLYGKGLRLEIVLDRLSRQYGLMPNYIWRIVSGKI